MPLTTTTIGAYPKPDYIPVPDWFDTGHQDSSVATRAYLDALRDMGAEAEATFARGVKQVIEDQVSAGIDIPTDGEVRRENYVHYHCRHLQGFDFDALERKVLREGSYETDLPTITGPVRAGAPFLPDDWRSAQSVTDRPVKITLPGPMTITDTTVDLTYGDEVKLGRDLAEALNAEVLALAAAGCRHIQIDEPVFARKPRQALDYGIENLERCWHGVPPGITKVAHICCGYPNYLDQRDYVKADRQAYFELATAMDETATDVISIEDAHRPNDLALLELFRRTGVILGVVAIADSRVESVEEVRARLKAALEHIPAERLMAGPDCGLGFLGRELSIKKLKVLSEAAHSL
jgi:5-methyltetrahydropteroyltriglutamate--homocysteine methyltransferase